MMTTRDNYPVLIGHQYKVDAINSKSTQMWEVVEIPNDGEVVCKTQGVSHTRIFKPTQLHSWKNSKQIISEEIDVVCEMDGSKLAVENIIWWPEQKRRGRKPKEQS